MPKVILSPMAEEDIDEARRFTRARFGERKDEEYRELILIALRALAENPHAGRARPEILPYTRTYHIARPGRRARHLFVYRVGDDGTVHVARFLYDGMDLPSHVPEEF